VRPNRPPRRKGTKPSASRSRRGADAPQQQGGRPGVFPIVGIGASAGGLEAFKKFFSTMPPDSGMAFVLVQHLDPTHESLTAELLGKITSMNVEQIVGDTPVRPNHVYVIPPNKYLALQQGVLQLSAFSERRVLRMPIDFFLRSLAGDRQEKAIAIILSGTGTDGALGAKEIKGAGGMVMVQDPQSALYDGMPQNAIATGAVDYVLAIEEMPAQLQRYVQHPQVKAAEARPAPERAQDQLGSIVALLKTRAGFDFGPYKKGTLSRRIHRRMGLRHVEQVGDYLQLLRNDPKEVKSLFKDLLIGVTTFFREPQAWECLTQEVIPRLVREKGPGTALRVWVPGCATGQEAYSIAMVLVEQMQAAQVSHEIQIFASDVERDALDAARAATYPESIAVDVSPERLRRFFTKVNGSYRVNKELREAVVFAEQNLITDPPFSKLDLISCRNLLIYLEEEVQRRIISLLHFALAEGGYLFLGPAETIGPAEDLFEPLSKKWRVYRRIGPTRYDRVYFPVVAPAEPPPERNRGEPVPVPNRLANVLQRVLLDRYVPASVVINRRNEILYYCGPTHLYLAHPPGPPTPDLLAQAREGLQTKLRNALHKAIRTGEPVAIGGLRIRRNGAACRVGASIEPLKEWKEAEGLLLVSFADEPEGAPAAAQKTRVAKEPEESLVRQLEYELKATREDLQSTIEEMETANEELKAANEEVMSVNEELQSTNEELETSKEELQSLNEELNTVNAQLQSKVDELESTNNDLDNLLTSTKIATVFLDKNLRIKRYTPAATNLFTLIATDIGRPLSDVVQKFVDPELLAHAQAVLDRLAPMQREVQGHNGRSYIRQALPYRTQDNRIDGVVVTFSDVAADALQESRQRADASANALRKSEDLLRTIVDTAADGIITIDERGAVRTFNPAAEQMFGYKAKEIIGQNVAMLMPSPYREEHERYIARYLETGIAKIIGVGREAVGRRKDGSVFPMDLAVSAFPDGAGRSFTGLVRDVTQRKEAERRTRERQLELAHVQRLTTSGELAAGVAHQLNQPLTAIANDLEACAARLRGKSGNGQVVELLEHATAQVMHADGILNHVRQFIRKREPAFEAADLREVVDGALALLRIDLERARVSPQLDLGSQPLPVRVDRILIEQVIVNLVQNALEALAPLKDGKKRLEIRAASQGTTAVELTISDSGPGIGQAKDHLFEPFFTTKTEGLGMGLVISRSIAEAHQGEVSLSARPDGRPGAVARLVLPLHSETRQQGRAAKAPARALQIADDTADPVHR